MNWLPQYTRKDLQILAVIMPLVVVLINSLLFGRRFFTEPMVFFGSGLIVLVVMTATWFLFTCLDRVGYQARGGMCWKH